MLNKLICKVAGHKRGVRVGESNLGRSKAATFMCSRCRSLWSRKVYPRTAKPGAAA